MRISKILLFVLGILSGLFLICVFIPEKGIKVGNITFEFPSLLEVLGANQTEDADSIEMRSPEQLLEDRMATLQTKKTDEFRKFASSSPQRIYMPQDDETYLDAFFQSLEMADSMHMRILHLGDSQLECDRISCSLRQHYQEEFGGHGVGLVPALQTVPTYTLSQSVSPSESVGHYIVYGPADVHASHHRYGIMGQVNHVVAGTSIRLNVRDQNKYPSSGNVKSIKVMACGSGGMTLRTSLGAQPMESTSFNEAYTLLSARLSSGVDAVTIQVHGDYDIYGIMLDDEVGVSLDNVPMRGCSGNIFTQIDEKTLAPFFKQENVSLVILQYGGNYVPVCHGERVISEYMKSLRRQIALLRRISPRSSFLFVGPADMATRMGGEMKTYPVLPQLVDSLREMSRKEGIAFWDMYNAMGGKGSIVRWYRASPQLAGSDFVHFTPKGAQKMADMLYGTLQMYYRFYRLRTGRENESDMQQMTFKDAVAPVEGSSVISVSEIPVQSHKDTLDVFYEDNAETESDIPTNSEPDEGNALPVPAEASHSVEVTHKDTVR